MYVALGFFILCIYRSRPQIVMVVMTVEERERYSCIDVLLGHSTFGFPEYKVTLGAKNSKAASSIQPHKYKYNKDVVVSSIESIRLVPLLRTSSMLPRALGICSLVGMT